jgi:hypothetical protein
MSSSPLFKFFEFTSRQADQKQVVEDADQRAEDDQETIDASSLKKDEMRELFGGFLLFICQFS